MRSSPWRTKSFKIEPYLATLKDLAIDLSVDAPHLKWKSKVVEVDVLRHVLIKWIKKWEGLLSRFVEYEGENSNLTANETGKLIIKETGFNTGCLEYGELTEVHGAIEWIKHFGNITEEDLK